MISVSYLKSKLSKEETIKKINESNADLIHVDLMDGKYVSESNFTINEVINDLKNTTKLLDIHLMTEEPLNYIKKLINLNIWCITFHLDSTKDPLKIINYLKEKHVKVGIALNPLDSINLLDNYLNLIDYVLVMSVNPGMGGQKFMPTVLPKINSLQNKNILIGIDGGINNESIKILKDYKIDNIVSGSFICLSDNYNKSIDILKKIYLD